MMNVLCKMVSCYIVQHGRVETLAKHIERQQHASDTAEHPTIQLLTHLHPFDEAGCTKQVRRRLDVYDNQQKGFSITNSSI